MTGITVLGAIVREWPERKYNLCEVCFKPFNLANIDMHLEAGCAAEIKERYKFITTHKTEQNQQAAQKTRIDKMNDRKSNKKRKTQTGKSSNRSKKPSKQ